MAEEDISQDSDCKNIEKIKNYFIKKIDQNELISNKNGKVCMTLIYIEYFLILVFAVIGYILISLVASLVDISMGIMSSTIGLIICAIIARTNNYK